MKYYLIGEIAKITGLSVHAIRYYEKNGIIEPSYVDEDTNYRYYSAEDVRLFEVLKECKKMELTLEQIKQIEEAEDDSQILDILLEQKRNIQNRLEHTMVVADNIEWYCNQYIHRVQTRRVCYIPFLRTLEARKVIYRPNPYEQRSSNVALAEIARDELEANDSIHKKIGFIGSLSGWKKHTRIICKGDYLDLLQRQYPRTDAKYIYDIPAGVYLCMNFDTDAVLDDDTATNGEYFPELQKMKEYMDLHNYEPKLIVVEEHVQSLKLISRVQCQLQILLEV